MHRAPAVRGPARVSKSPPTPVALRAAGLSRARSSSARTPSSDAASTRSPPLARVPQSGLSPCAPPSRYQQAWRERRRDRRAPMPARGTPEQNQETQQRQHKVADVLFLLFGAPLHVCFAAPRVLRRRALCCSAARAMAMCDAGAHSPCEKFSGRALDYLPRRSGRFHAPRQSGIARREALPAVRWRDELSVRCAKSFAIGRRT